MVWNGKVSVEAARARYGVAVNSRGVTFSSNWQRQLRYPALFS
jgi:hypothetical protein